MQYSVCFNFIKKWYNNYIQLIIKIFIVFFIFTKVVSAGEFKLEFEWGNLKKCNTGNPNKVDNPLFKLSNVPQGTIILQFKMKDKDAPGYNHGGGKVEYTG